MSLAKRIVACLDVDAGRVVKGVRFQELRDIGDPVELATRYEHEGADEVVFLDISASHEGRQTTLEVVRRTAQNLFIPLTVGGGIRTPDDMRAALNAGADKVAINTAALLRPALITECSRRFGAQCVVVAVDAKRVPAEEAAAPAQGGGEPTARAAASTRPPAASARAGGPTASDVSTRWTVHTHGGRQDTGIDAIAWCQEAARLGAGEILLTSMDADGTRDGYDLELTHAVAQAVPIPVVASGGCGSATHMVDALASGADAALAASIFHDGDATVQEVKHRLADAGLVVRV